MTADLSPTIWDEQEYLQLARTLATCGEFGYEPGKLSSLRPPLYPSFLALSFSLFGIDNLAATRAVQVAVSVLTIVVCYHLALAVTSRKSAMTAAFICAFYPSIIGYTALNLTETLFTFLLTSTCYSASLLIRSARFRWAIVTGTLMGLAALTRSVVWLMPLVLTPLFVIWLKDSWIRRITLAAAFLTAYVGVVAPWMIRNTHLQGGFVAIDCMGGRNFMMGNYRYTPLFRSWDAISLTGEMSWSNELFAIYPPEARPTQGHVDRLAMRQAIDFIAAHPGLTLLRDGIKFLDFWGIERELISAASAGRFGITSRSAVAMFATIIVSVYIAVMFFAIFGAVFGPTRNRNIVGLMATIIAVICGMHVLTFGHSRYHLPLMPLLIIFAAHAWTMRQSIWQQRTHWRFKMAAGICGLLTLGWVALGIAVDAELLWTAMVR